ncbi:MAG: trk/ktr system potassium uptake protein [Archaeoglobaceae archaeon]|nr:trk/ktr system potassium uptake protein [Archaeoglobaceae archaeon]
MTYILVSTGDKAARIASKLPNCIIIDRNPDSAKRLAEMGFEVLNVDASNLEVLAKFDRESKMILADEDEFNLKVARVAKMLGFDVFVIAEDEEKCRLYENERISKICGSVESLLSAIFEKSRYFEIKVGEEMDGKTLKEYDAGEDCMVIPVFRNGKVLQPFPELELKAGDTLALVCGEHVRLTKNPFDSILLIKSDEIGEKEIREAEMVAKRFGANLIVLEKVGDVYACVLEGQSDSVDLEEAVRMLKRSDEFDLIATMMKEKNEDVLKLLVSNFPTLLLSGKKDYSKILVLVNNSNPDTIINIAKAFSRFFGTVKVLFLDEEQIKHFSKFTETDLEVEVSRGNPMVDAVKEFKSGYDLVIFSLTNDAGNIDRDILWKIILDRETSVLVVE